jgi:hypothetical protein
MTMRKIGTCFCKFSISAALFVKTATSNNLQDEFCHTGTYILGIHPGFHSNCRPSFCHLLSFCSVTVDIQVCYGVSREDDWKPYYQYSFFPWPVCSNCKSTRVTTESVWKVTKYVGSFHGQFSIRVESNLLLPDAHRQTNERHFHFLPLIYFTNWLIFIIGFRC